MVEIIKSSDGETTKYLFETKDKHYFEMVIFPFRNQWGTCISSQIGCPFLCDFCNSGELPFLRNLEADELLAQIAFARKNIPPTHNLYCRTLFFWLMSNENCKNIYPI